MLALFFGYRCSLFEITESKLPAASSGEMRSPCVFKMKKFFLFFLIAFFAFTAVAFAGELKIACASDLTPALKEMAAEFSANTGAAPVISPGSTGMLARQIGQGAPFDLFFAADMEYLRRLDSGGHILKGSARPYAQGRIALAINKKTGFRPENIKDLLKPEVKRIAIANPAHAPYGVAAVEALKSSGIYDEVRQKLVYGENVRQAMQFVATGNAQAGIVALSITDSPEAFYLTLDKGLHKPITQGVAVISSSANIAQAKRFMEFAVGKRGRDILKKYGFLVED